MLKKTAVVSFVLLILFIIIFAALTPLATADMITMMQSGLDEYSAPVELLCEPADGITSVKVAGDWIDDLLVVPSPNGDIHVLTDGFRVFPVEIEPFNDGSGCLQLSFSMNKNAAKALSRESIVRMVTAELNDRSTNRIILQLPEGVNFISQSHYENTFGGLHVDGSIDIVGWPPCDEEWYNEREEERLEREAEREEERAERASERLERAIERAVERAEEKAERIENSAAKTGEVFHHSDNNIRTARLVIV